MPKYMRRSLSVTIPNRIAVTEQVTTTPIQAATTPKIGSSIAVE